MGRAALVTLFLSFAGCTVRASVPRDSGIDVRRPDAAGLDAGADSGADAGADSGTDAGEDGGSEIDGGLDAATETDSGTDAGAALDAGADSGLAPDAGSDAGAPDAGRPAPTIDGTLSFGEWTGAALASDTTASTWTGSELRAVRALLRAEGLYLAIDGRVQDGNAIAVYVDRARGASEGVTLSSLTDSTGALDDALTAGFTTPSDVRPDLAWGTLDLSRTAATSDDRMGWRDLGRGSPADLYWITTAESACAASSCEAFLPRAALDYGSGAVRPRTVALFVRITNPDGTLSPNQTLPSDDPSAPRTVSVVLELAE